MAITAKMFGQFLMTCMRQEVNLETDTLKIMLLTSTAALGATQQDTWVYKIDVTNEVVGDGYTTGGLPISLAVGTLSYTTANLITFKPVTAFVEWNPSTITARYAVIYDDTPALDEDKPVIGWLDFGADQVSTAGSFKITFDTTGMFTLTVTA